MTQKHTSILINISSSVGSSKTSKEHYTSSFTTFPRAKAQIVLHTNLCQVFQVKSNLSLFTWDHCATIAPPLRDYCATTVQNNHTIATTNNWSEYWGYILNTNQSDIIGYIKLLLHWIKYDSNSLLLYYIIFPRFSSSPDFLKLLVS